MSSLFYDTNWAVTEFADAELGDLRRTQRLVELAGVLAQHPTAALPEACGDGAMLKAAYRFFDNDAVEPQDVLLSHIEATYARLAQVPLVLAVQDTTEVDWTAH
ncbi:MAG: transposase DNA-binding-containing protein, partial [Candidatus Tectomicrobia bacterium]